MNLTGKIKEITTEVAGELGNQFYNKLFISFEVESIPYEEFNELKNYEKLDIEIRKFKKRRSLDANAYMWVLLQKIAEATHSDKWSVYLQMLQRYSREFTFVICKEQAVERLKELYRTCVDLGEVKVNGMEGHQIQVYFGSSTFDSKAMAVLLDGVVSECKELGIETLSPRELERIKKEWGK